MIKAQFFKDRVLCFSYLCAMLMVGVEVSWVVSAFAATTIFWRYGSERWSWPILNRKITGTLSVLILAQVLIEFRTLIGQEPSYTLLLGLSALRVMEYETPRDKKFVVLLGFILLAVKALFTLDIYWLIPTALSFVGLWYSLLPAQLERKRTYLLSLFLRALPVAAILFLVFPRVVIPWALARGTQQGEVGFSEDLNPGGVANLANSDKVAFRARFLTNTPNISDLYWRGAVLNRSLGLSWKPVRQLFLPQKDSSAIEGPDYEVALDASSKSFLFTLDETQKVLIPDMRILVGENQQFRTQRPIQKAIVYQGFLSNAIPSKAPEKEDLQIPTLTGATLEWVEGQRLKKLSPTDTLKVLEKFFADPRFAYTLSPGSYELDEINEFLFKRRRGFCEHFAGSYATLARALGIPSRVIVGYHGGLYNEWGEFWRVSQKDAHAWVEVFLENHWQRIDPTSWVAPLRLRIGAESFFALSEADQQAFAKSVDWKPSFKKELWNLDNVSLWIESLNYHWIYLLIDFDLDAQVELFRSFVDLRWLLLISLVFGGAAFMVIKRAQLSPRGLSPEEKLLFKVELWGAKKNLPRQVSETPLQYFLRLQEVSREPVFAKVGTYYEEAVYAKLTRPKPEKIKELMVALRKAKLKA